MKLSIRLDTLSDVKNFVKICQWQQCNVWLEDGDGQRVSGKSLLGAIASMEWNHLYVYSDVDFSGKIIQFIKSDSNE